MKINLLGKVLVLLVSILGLLFFIFSLVSSFTSNKKPLITSGFFNMPIKNQSYNYNHRFSQRFLIVLTVQSLYF